MGPVSEILFRYRRCTASDRIVMGEEIPSAAPHSCFAALYLKVVEL